MVPDVEREWIAEELRNNPVGEGRPPLRWWLVALLLAVAALILRGR